MSFITNLNLLKIILYIVPTGLKFSLQQWLAPVKT